MNKNVKRVVHTETDMFCYEQAKKYFWGMVEAVKNDNVVLYVLTRNKKFTAIENFLSRRDFLSLSKGNGLAKYRKVVWNSLSTLKDMDNSLILCLYYNSNDLEKVDEKLGDNVAVVVIEWMKGDCQEWEDRWNNSNINADTWCDEFPEHLFNGLEWLSEAININCWHPLDEERIKTTVRVIHKFFPNASIDKIRDSLIRDFHWKLHYADKFTNWLEVLQNGKRFMGGDKTGLERILDRWKIRSSSDA